MIGDNSRLDAVIFVHEYFARGSTCIAFIRRHGDGDDGGNYKMMRPCRNQALMASFLLDARSINGFNPLYAAAISSFNPTRDAVYRLLCPIILLIIEKHLQCVFGAFATTKEMTAGPLISQLIRGIGCIVLSLMHLRSIPRSFLSRITTYASVHRCCFVAVWFPVS